MFVPSSEEVIMMNNIKMDEWPRLNSTDEVLRYRLLLDLLYRL